MSMTSEVARQTSQTSPWRDWITHPDKAKAQSSWWVGVPTDGFTARALREWPRMRLDSRESKVSGYACPVGEGTSYRSKNKVPQRAWQPSEVIE